MLSIESIRAVKEILLNFEHISGLACNYDKTVIVPLGNPDPDLIDQIRDLGFSLSDSVKLLGVEINKNLSNIDKIWTAIIEEKKLKWLTFGIDLNYLCLEG